MNKRIEREKAVKWWHTLSLQQKQRLTSTNFEGRDCLYLTGREIQLIYSNQKDIDIEEKNIIKPNKKQFVKFDGELHLLHISKFTIEDRHDAVAIGLLTLNLPVEDITRITDILVYNKNKFKSNS